MRAAWLGAAGLFLLAAAPPASAPLRDALWTDSNADVARLLTETPAECLASHDRQAIAIGRALFRSPGILRGPAARLGLSCNACHPGGHANAAFDLPELTDRPGAADVTAEWASAVRGDGIMNPVPIPDLTDLHLRKSFGHGREPSLATFVNKVVTEEFQGDPLPDSAMADLLAYLNALDSTHCPKNAIQPITLDSAAAEVHEAIEAADLAPEATAKLVLLAAQEALGRIAERLPGPRFQTERRALEDRSREVGSWRRDPSHLMKADPGWMARFDGLIAALQRRERETYFNAETLRAALK